MNATDILEFFWKKYVKEKRYVRDGVKGWIRDFVAIPLCRIMVGNYAAKIMDTLCFEENFD